MPGSDTPARRKPGPESTCTPELTERICVHIRKGVQQKYACPAEGLNWNTARDWNRYGRQGKEPYASVWTPAIAAARAFWVAQAVGRISEHAEKDWKADAWLLERRVKDFMKPEHRKIELTGKDGGPIRTTSTEDLLAVIRSTEDVTD
jgi:hypothetical protein